ncbi:MAG: hypothetical protein KatS3mg097_043 [Candidatus Parcubacteria bacterium]|nr:MAG: hypothetical protein KatS3mg097_043 [Candidatus Parcubacteria bacterium]
MNSSYFYIILSIATIISFILIIFTVLHLKKYRQKVQLKLAFSYVLLLIELPKSIILAQQQSSNPDPRLRIIEEITTFENFLSHFSKIKNPIVFEIATPHYGEEIFFYAAMHRKDVDYFNKVLKGAYPGAETKIIETDYNIFNPNGVSLLSIVTQKNHHFLPIRTYKSIALGNIDPFDAFLSAFSKLDKEGEGLAYQLIIKPAPQKIHKKIFQVIKKLREGENLEEALKIHFFYNIISLFQNIFKEFFVSEKKKEEEKQEKTKPKPAEETAIKQLEEKNAKSLFHVNVRLVCSTYNHQTANNILTALEGPFNQFVNPGFNEFLIQRKHKNKLLKSIYDFSFRIFQKKETMLLNTEEIASIFHFPISYTKNPLIHWLLLRSAPPPINLPTEGVILGVNNYQGNESLIRITKNDRRRHIYVIGQTGTGKTTLLKNIIEQDISNGDGVCFLDPHGDVAEEILGLIPPDKAENVIYFNPGDTRKPLGLNILEYNPQNPEDKTFIINTLIEIIDKLYNLQVTGGPMFEQYLRNALLLIMDNPEWGHTLLDVSRVFVDDDFRDRLLNECKNYPVIEFWRKQAERITSGDFSLENMTTWITSKLNPFITNDFVRPIIAQSKSSLNFREIMDNQKILIVNLAKGKLGETSAYLLGMVLVTKILLAALSRIDTPEQQRKDFYLFIDEFQNFAFKSVSTILSEARKYRLSLTLAHQFIKQVPEEIIAAVIGNVGTIISFRIGVEDAELLERQFSPVFSKADLVNIPNYNAYIKYLINGVVTSAFNIQTLKPKPENKKLSAMIMEMSMLKYGKPRELIEEEIAKKYQNDFDF